MTAAAAPAMNQQAASPSRPWLAKYSAKVPHTIDEGRLGTIADVFRTSVQEFAARPAVESFGKRMTYAELGQAANAVASWLQT